MLLSKESVCEFRPKVRGIHILKVVAKCDRDYEL